MYCPKDDEYVRSRDVVRGYEYAKGRYVVLTEDDFDRVPVKTKHRIDVVGFVRPEQVDPVYYADVHYLEPEELGERPFALLHRALQDTDRAGVAKVTLQRREHLCLLRPLDDILALHTLHYQAEVRSPNKLAGPEEKPTEEETRVSGSGLDFGCPVQDTLVAPGSPNGRLAWGRHYNADRCYEASGY